MKKKFLMIIVVVTTAIVIGIATIAANSPNLVINRCNGIYLSGTYDKGYTDRILEKWPFQKGDELRLNVKVYEGNIGWLRFYSVNVPTLVSELELLSEMNLSKGNYEYEFGVLGSGQWTMFIAPTEETKAEFCITGIEGTVIETPPEHLQGHPRIHSNSLIYK